VTGARSPAGRPRTSDRIEAASSTERAATRSANVLKRRASAKRNPSLSVANAPGSNGAKSRGISHAERHVARLVRCPFNTAYTRFQREVKRLPAEKSARRRARRAKSNGRTTLGLEKFFSALIARAPARFRPRAESPQAVGACLVGRNSASAKPSRIARDEREKAARELPRDARTTQSKNWLSP
jgi:hypothetical protein